MNKFNILIVGVSNYKNIFDLQKFNNLPLCKYDIYLVDNTFKKLEESKNDVKIKIIGKDGNAYKDTLIKSFVKISKTISNDEIFVFYFTGHGCFYNSKYSLVLSNYILKAEDLLSVICNIKCKRKIIIVDSCYSGNLKSEELNKYFENKCDNNGIDLLLSCDKNEECGFYSDKKSSQFTKFFVDAMNNNDLCYMDEVIRLIAIYNDSYNKRNSGQQFFKYFSNDTNSIEIRKNNNHDKKNEWINFNNFWITQTKIETKRVPYIYYKITCKILIKLDNYSLNFINEIINQVEAKYKDKEKKVFFLHIALNRQDIIHSNYYCRIIWSNEEILRNKFYKDEGVDKQNRNIIFNEQYFSIKGFFKLNAEDDEKILNSITELRKELENIFYDFKNKYNKLIGKEISKDKFMDEIKVDNVTINELIKKVSNLGLCSDNIFEWYEKNLELFNIAYTLICYNDGDYRFDYYLKEYDKKLSQLEKIEKV